MGSNPVRTLFIRTDANAQIGTGHIMRCLALAQAWQEGGGRAAFVTGMEVLPLENKLKSEGIEVFKISAQPGSADDAIHTVDHARRLNPQWIVLDGYNFDPTYHRQIKGAGYQLMVIDDMAHLGHYYADIVLNQNIHAKSLKYCCEPYTKLLLEAKYVLLRREFLKWQGWKREIPESAHKILVSLGGADPDNVTLKVVQALKKIDIPNLGAKIIVGPSNPHLDELQSAIRNPQSKINVLHNPPNMPELMTWADLAISGAGCTSMELAFMGVPSIVLVMSENQGAIAEELGKIGTVFNLGWHEQVSPSQVTQAMTQLLLSAKARAGMASRGHDLVDGDGIDRVLMRMLGRRIRLRRVREEDGHLIWEWANDSGVRTGSFFPSPILWEDHMKWFHSKLKNPHCLFYIALNEEDVPIGQVRYDVKDDEAIVSISVGSSFRGKRYGKEIMELSSRKLFRVLDAKCIRSYVKMGNEASARMFLEAGFTKSGTGMIHGKPAVHLVLRKEGAA